MYTKYMGALTPSVCGAPDYSKAENRPYTTNSNGTRAFHYTESQSGWLFIQYVADGFGSNRANRLMIDGTAFVFNDTNGEKHYIDYVSYQVPIGAGSTWDFSFQGQRATVTFVPSGGGSLANDLIYEEVA